MSGVVCPVGSQWKEIRHRLAVTFVLSLSGVQVSDQNVTKRERERSCLCLRLSTIESGCASGFVGVCACPFFRAILVRVVLKREKERERIDVRDVVKRVAVVVEVEPWVDEEKFARVLSDSDDARSTWWSLVCAGSCGRRESPLFERIAFYDRKFLESIGSDGPEVCGDNAIVKRVAVGEVLGKKGTWYALLMSTREGVGLDESMFSFAK